MVFQHHGQLVQLQGISASAQECPLISTIQLQLLQVQEAVLHFVHLCAVKPDPEVMEILAAVGQLLSEFTALFEEPRGLPPQRPFDYDIELLPGVAPVNIRPYRYNPTQKDEIKA